MAQAVGHWAVGAIIALGLSIGGIPALAADPQSFSTPEEAAKALLAALGSNDANSVWTVLGDEYRDDLENADQAQEQESWRRVVEAAAEVMELRADDEKTRVMVIGKQVWPLPIPIVKGDKGWYFDTGAGVDEIIARRIGANELSTIANLQAYVDAQVQYASADRDGDDVLEYAKKIVSTPGKQDGLYWKTPADSDEEASPFGPFAAEHTAYRDEFQPGDPLQGYYYRVISRQGEGAPGGRYDYVINGNMIAGFAMVAWPADYGSTGVMTFVVSQNGRVFQKDLGDNTPLAVAAIQVYEPDEQWALAGE
ncbi:MAG: DUF2950 family protein [Dongiaceae bacterium]